MLKADLNLITIKPVSRENNKFGWRVEFRASEIQPTDFENSALTIAVGMIINLVNTFDLDFIIPISLVDENMNRACGANAAKQAKFHWKVPKDQYKSISRLTDLEDTNFLKSNNTMFGKSQLSDAEQCQHHSCEGSESKEEAKRIKELTIA